jgi:3-oxoadipate enol-lactonase
VARTRSRPVLHYVTEGTGPPVIFSHALGLDLHLWDAIVPRLAAMMTTVRYDVRGHGRSEPITAPFDISDLVDDAIRLIDELRYDRVSWVGLSLGGMIGQGLAIAHPDRIERLVLANTMSRYPDENRVAWRERAHRARTEGMAALADFVMTRYFSPAFGQSRPDEVARTSDVLVRVDPFAYAAFCDAIASLDYADRLGQIRCPALAITGDADVAALPTWTGEIAERIPGARLATIAGAGHLSVLERPEEFVTLVESGLSRT